MTERVLGPVPTSQPTHSLLRQTCLNKSQEESRVGAQVVRPGRAKAHVSLIQRRS